MAADTAAQPAESAPRLSRHDETRARILAAAQDILLERTSADALPLREVARRAGFAPGALYRYFEGRDDLIQSLYLAALQVLGSYLGAADGETAVERLLSLGRAYLLFGRERPQDLVLLFESAVPSATWADYVGVAWPFTLIVETVAAGIESRELAPLPGLDAAGTASPIGRSCTASPRCRRATSPASPATSRPCTPRRSAPSWRGWRHTGGTSHDPPTAPPHAGGRLGGPAAGDAELLLAVPHDLGRGAGHHHRQLHRLDRLVGRGAVRRARRLRLGGARSMASTSLRQGEARQAAAARGGLGIIRYVLWGLWVGAAVALLVTPAWDHVDVLYLTPHVVSVDPGRQPHHPDDADRRRRRAGAAARPSRVLPVPLPFRAVQHHRQPRGPHRAAPAAAAASSPGARAASAARAHAAAP